jgi:hypothetical protein
MISRWSFFAALILWKDTSCLTGKPKGFELLLFGSDTDPRVSSIKSVILSIETCPSKTQFGS